MYDAQYEDAHYVCVYRYYGTIENNNYRTGIWNSVSVGINNAYASSAQSDEKRNFRICCDKQIS